MSTDFYPHHEPDEILVVRKKVMGPDEESTGLRFPGGDLVANGSPGLTIWFRTADLAANALAGALAKVRRLLRQPGPSQAALDVIAERQRQGDEEGIVDADDDHWTDGELALAASCYAKVSAWAARYTDGLTARFTSTPEGWPWGNGCWNPKNRRRDLVRAGALILAEIERLDRAAAKQGCQCPACAGGIRHTSDCAVHNAPASPPGPCNCGAQP